MTKDEVIPIEKETIKPAARNKWKFLRENRITTSIIHKSFIRKKIKSLFENKLSKKEKQNSQVCPRSLNT